VYGKYAAIAAARRQGQSDRIGSCRERIWSCQVAEFRMAHPRLRGDCEHGGRVKLNWRVLQPSMEVLVHGVGVRRIVSINHQMPTRVVVRG